MSRSKRSWFLTPADLVRIEGKTAAEALVLPTLHVTHLQTPILEIPPGLTGNTTTAIYEDLVNWVSQEALAGDKDAAELIILCSIARVWVNLSIFMLHSSILFQPIERPSYLTPVSANHEFSLFKECVDNPHNMFGPVETVTVIFCCGTLAGSFEPRSICS